MFLFSLIQNSHWLAFSVKIYCRGPVLWARLRFFQSAQRISVKFRRDGPEWGRRLESMRKSAAGHLFSLRGVLGLVGWLV